MESTTQRTVVVEQSNFVEKMEKTGTDFVEKVATKTHIPFGIVLFIVLIIILVILFVFYFCISKWWKKWRRGDAKLGKVDFKSVQLLGQTYKEKVQPDLEDLTSNMEEQQHEEEKKEEQKLGRLQFKIDYDFNQSNVCIRFNMV